MQVKFDIGIFGYGCKRFDKNQKNKIKYDDISLPWGFSLSVLIDDEYNDNM